MWRQAHGGDIKNASCCHRSCPFHKDTRSRTLSGESSGSSLCATGASPAVIHTCFPPSLPLMFTEYLPEAKDFSEDAELIRKPPPPPIGTRETRSSPLLKVTQLVRH